MVSVGDSKECLGNDYSLVTKKEKNADTPLAQLQPVDKRKTDHIPYIKKIYNVGYE